MKKGDRLKVRGARFIGLVFSGLLLATAGLAQVTVVGTNSYPADVNNVQAAVGPYATVYLSGTFDFGAAGSVIVNVPNVTLEGVSTGATIRGGTNPVTTFSGILPSSAKNVTIRNIHFIGWNESAILHLGVLAEDNRTLIEGNTFENTFAPVDPFGGFGGITYWQCAGSAVIRNNRLLDFSYPAILAHELTLHADDRLLIEGNTIVNASLDGITVEVWDPSAGDLDNGPVTIRNNNININGALAWGVDLGGYWFWGSSNVVVEDNVITGRGDVGITGYCYGHSRRILDNDLTGLVTVAANIYASGRGDLISGNALGTTDIQASIETFGVPFLATGIWLTALTVGGPDPLPVSNNILADNDFRRTGLKGWAYDVSGDLVSVGCVLLASHADVWGTPPWPGAHITDNLIKENGRFPPGTGGAKEQILEFPVYAHDNRIVGHKANEYSQLEAMNPGLGQKLKDAMAKYVERLRNRRALARQR